MSYQLHEADREKAKKVHFLEKASMGTEADSATPSWKPEASVMPVGTLGNSGRAQPWRSPHSRGGEGAECGHSCLAERGRS